VISEACLSLQIGIQRVPRHHIQDVLIRVEGERESERAREREREMERETRGSTRPWSSIQTTISWYKPQVPGISYKSLAKTKTGTNFKSLARAGGAGGSKPIAQVEEGQAVVDSTGQDLYRDVDSTGQDKYQ